MTSAMMFIERLSHASDEVLAKAHFNLKLNRNSLKSKYTTTTDEKVNIIKKNNLRDSSER